MTGYNYTGLILYSAVNTYCSTIMPPKPSSQTQCDSTSLDASTNFTEQLLAALQDRRVGDVLRDILMPRLTSVIEEVVEAKTADLQDQIVSLSKENEELKKEWSRWTPTATL